RPVAPADTAAAACARGGFRAYVVVELPIIEHLGPKAPVDEIADVLDELTVDVRGNGGACLPGIDGYCDFSARRRGGLRRGAEWQQYHRKVRGECVLHLRPLLSIFICGLN